VLSGVLVADIKRESGDSKKFAGVPQLDPRLYRFIMTV